MAKIKRLNKNTKIILNTLLSMGIFATIAISPMILPAFGIIIVEKEKSRINRAKAKNFINTFYTLKRRGMIDFEKRNNQVYISLTKKGKKQAGKYQINDLSIKKPKRWDKKWRIVIFDIPSNKKIVREALRGKLKRLNFYQLQKSVWAHPFDCFKEIKLLKEFFCLNDNELRIIVSDDIGDDEKMKERYDL
jgi:hypothetical protein